MRVDTVEFARARWQPISSTADAKRIARVLNSQCFTFRNLPSFQWRLVEMFRPLNHKRWDLVSATYALKVLQFDINIKNTSIQLILGPLHPQISWGGSGTLSADHTPIFVTFPKDPITKAVEGDMKLAVLNKEFRQVDLVLKYVAEDLDLAVET